MIANINVVIIVAKIWLVQEKYIMKPNPTIVVIALGTEDWISISGKSE